jgi:hypothetical protein
MSTARRLWFGLIGLTLGCYAAVWQWPAVLAVLGIRLPRGHWFVDTYALLAASDAFALGLNPYVNNPLDLLNVPHWYSDWWFWLHDLGLSRADAGWLGAGVVLLFLLAALLLLRPQNRTELLLHWLVLCSPPVLLGANRANADLLIFAALALAGWLLTRPVRALRLLGPLVIAVMAGLKFYPLAAAAALPFTPQTRRENWFLLGFMAVLTVLLGLGLYDDVLRVRALISDMPVRLYTFGAAVGLPSGSGAMRTVLVGCLAVALPVFWWRRAPEPPAGLDPRATMLFVLGTATVVGCFFVGLSFNYRLVFGLLQLPLLGALCRQEPANNLRRLAVAAWAGLLALLWTDGLACLLLRLRLDWLDLPAVVDCRQAVYALVSWVWIGAVTGLWVALARPACRRLLPP